MHIDDYMQRMVEAMDPESGVEDAYHPRRDVGYCFKGLRAAAREGYTFLENVTGAEFEYYCLAKLGKYVEACIRLSIQLLTFSRV